MNLQAIERARNASYAAADLCAARGQGDEQERHLKRAQEHQGRIDAILRGYAHRAERDANARRQLRRDSRNEAVWKIVTTEPQIRAVKCVRDMVRWGGQSEATFSGILEGTGGGYGSGMEARADRAIRARNGIRTCLEAVSDERFCVAAMEVVLGKSIQRALNASGFTSGRNGAHLKRAVLEFLEAAGQVWGLR